MYACMHTQTHTFLLTNGCGSTVQTIKEKKTSVIIKHRACLQKRKANMKVKAKTEEAGQQTTKPAEWERWDLDKESTDRRGRTTNNQASRMRTVGPWQRKQKQQNDRKHGTTAEAVWRREAWCNAVCRSLTYKGAVRVQLLWCSRLREWGWRRDWGLGITRVIFPCVCTPAKIIRHTAITRNNTVQKHRYEYRIKYEQWSTGVS